ncbi:MAG: hypothetical protein OHK0052_23070 [Anaerolineales bacterium]
MRRFSLNQILISLIGLQLLLSVLTLMPRQRPAQTAQPLWIFNGDQVVSLIIEDSTGSKVLLSQRAGTWVLPSADDYPADATKINSFLQKLSTLKTDRLITQTATSHRRLQVDAKNFNRRVSITQNDGTQYTLYIGSSPSGGAVHIRLDGQNQVYLTNQITAWDANAAASGWIDTAYLMLTSAEITGVEIQNTNGILKFNRTAENDWQTAASIPAEKMLNSNALNTLVSRLSTLRMVAPLGKTLKPEYGLNPPRATVTLTRKDGSNIRLEVGEAQNGSQNYAVYASTSQYAVLVSSFSVEDLLNATLNDYLEDIPTPTPTP